MKEKNNKGQSTIEFILTFSAAIGFIFLFLKMAINYTNGYMVHHATYLASRAYLVGDTESQQSKGGRDKAAFELAKSVFTKNLPDDLQSSFDGKLKENNPESGNLAVFTGVWVEFSQAFSIGMVGGKEPVKFRSESFLGREPTRVEVFEQICEAIRSVAQSCEVHATLEDNGG